MLARLDNWCGAARRALGFDKLNSVDELTTTITLVTFCIREATSFERASTAHHAISERRGARITVLLLNCVLISVTSIFQVIENVLRNLCLLFSRGSSKIVEVTVEPLVNLGVLSVVVVTDLLACHAFLTSLCLSGSSILVSTADVDDVVAGKTAESGVHVSREYAADNIT